MNSYGSANPGVSWVEVLLGWFEARIDVSFERLDGKKLTRRGKQCKL